MNAIELFPLTGEFAENKDIARDVRMRQIVPALDRGEEVVLDFEGVDATTQSFIHALISDLLRKYGSDVVDRIAFAHCNETVRKIITIVVDYTQEAE